MFQTFATFQTSKEEGAKASKVSNAFGVNAVKKVSASNLFNMKSSSAPLYAADTLLAFNRHTYIKVIEKT